MSSGERWVWRTAQLFRRAWQVRLAAVFIAVAIAGITVTNFAVSTLLLSPSQQASRYLGESDAMFQLPTGVPLGSDTAPLKAQLHDAVKSGGGSRVSVDYLLFGLRTDDAAKREIALSEIGDLSTVASQVDLDSRYEPGAVGEAIVSTALTHDWPVGSTIELLGGALRLKVVGVFSDVYDTSSRRVVVPAGTWGSLSTLSADAAEKLHQAAAVSVRWAGPDSVDAVTSAIAESLSLTPDQLGQGGLLQTRAQVQATSQFSDAALTIILWAGPPVAGILAGVIAGSFLRRTRRVMWTIGVPYSRTRSAAFLTVTIASTRGALIGLLVGVGTGLVARPLIASLAGQPSGIFPSAQSLFAGPALAVVGSVAGFALIDSLRRRGDRVATPRAKADRAIYRNTLAVVLGAAGVFVVTGEASRSTQTVGAVLISVGIIIAVAGPAIRAVGRWNTRSFSTRLAARRLASEHRESTLTVVLIASLQAVGLVLITILNSSLSAANAETESFVPPDQIRVAIPSDIDAGPIRADIEQYLGVTDPVATSTFPGQIQERNGSTWIVSDPNDIERLIDRALTPEELAFAGDGGYLLTGPASGSEVSLVQGDSVVAIVPAMELQDLDPSFSLVAGFLTESAASKSGIVTPQADTWTYVGVDPSLLKRASTIAADLSLNPVWVETYAAPEDITASFRMTLIAAMISSLAGVVLLVSAGGQSRAMRPELSGLRAVGVSGRFLARVTFVRIGITIGLSLLLSAVAVTIAAAITLAIGIGIPVAPPLDGFLVAVVFMTGLGCLVGWWTTRRLVNSEWQN